MRTSHREGVRAAKHPLVVRTRGKGSRAITYGHLSHALEGLGYERREAKGRLIMFVHSKTKAAVILPWRSASQKIDPTRLAVVYQLVSAGDVANLEVLEDALLHQ